MTDILQTIMRKLSQGRKDFSVERWMLTPKDQPLIDHGVFTFNGKFSDRYPCPNCEAPFQFTLKDGMYYGVCTSCATLGEDAWPPSQVELMDFSYRKFILFINNPTVTGEYVEEAAKCLTDDLAKADGLEEEVFASCETPEELLRYLAGKDARSEVAHLIRIGLLFKENWFFIVTEDGEADGKPDGWHYFESLEQTLNHEIAKIAKGEVKAPCSCGEWQRILPEALTFPYDEAIYYEAAEDDEDPAVAEYTILGDRKVRVGWKYRPQPLAPYIDKVRDLLPAYLTEALKYAQSINSRSSEQWAVALGCFNRVKHAFTMPQSRPLLDQMAQAMIDAATRLEIDIKFASTEVAPVPAYITGVSKEGGKALRAEMKDKGGPTAKPIGAFLKHSQKDVALMFGPPCNLDMVANWEAYEKTNGKRGAMPPSAIVDGKAYPYSVGLRVNPSPKNKIILAALIEEFKKTAGVKDGISKFVHPRSEESLSRAPKA